ncbi:MAG TPA: glycoside hydrolase family 27 protein [Pyrinomonadaceae bacterium]|jgi:alpha-galactosidase|nr:glycoside hydrolase family 27 protein [Pyrinomonadaceae bacterium]
MNNDKLKHIGHSDAENAEEAQRKTKMLVGVENMNSKTFSGRFYVIGGALLVSACLAMTIALARQQSDNPLTGNWAAASPGNDGYVRKAYFNLKQDGAKITGTIRATQFFYTIKESTGGPDGFTLMASMMDGKSERKVTYEGKLIGNELQIGRRNRPDQPITFQMAQRAPDGEGALPARDEPPALHKVKDNGLARTPPMGWNSWNKFAGRIDDATVRGVADAMATNGMKAAGYVYINIDDTWEGYRDAQGNITTNKKFPDMKALADYVHSKGLKLGIYSSPGPNTCAGYEGTYGHEEQDAQTFAKWGIDYLKYDWCGARTLYTDEEMPAIYQKMGDALLKTGRPIVYSLCQYGRLDVWKWGADVGGNLWRTTGDIRDTWDSMTNIGFRQNELAPFAKPGHWNDPDMLEIGNGGMTDTEYRTHMSLWAVLAAPLLAGNDLRNMTPATLEILTNKEVIAINQDKLGQQGKQVWKAGDQEIWTRPLSGGDTAVAIFNRGKDEAKVTLKWTDLQLAKKKVARDLWLHQDVAAAGPEYVATVPGHGVALLRVR